jgi:hypothetical protein
MKDAAAKIAEKYIPGGVVLLPEVHRGNCANRIRLAIRRAVKAERERCVKCVQYAANCKIIATSGLAAMRVMEQVAIEAINTPAKRPSKRKGKR